MLSFLFLPSVFLRGVSLIALYAVLGLASLALGLFFYGINAVVWSNCVRDINSSLSYVECLEKQLKQSETKQESTIVKEEHRLPNKYLNRGYDEIQIEYIKEALYVNGLTEKDVDYFLSLKDGNCERKSSKRSIRYF